MRYAFLNNFTQALAADLAQGATSMTLDNNGTLLANASSDLVYTLTLFDVTSGENEIVRVTAVAGNDLTVVRGQEGTTDRAWPTGTQVEMRLTAGALGGLNSVIFDGWGSVVVAPDSGTVHDPSGDGGVIVVGDAVAHMYGAVAIGTGASADYEGVAVGSNANAGDSGGYNNDWNVAVGAYSVAKGYTSTAIGGYASVYADGAVAIGVYSSVYANQGVAIGESAAARGENSVCLGYRAVAGETNNPTKGSYSTAVGPGAYVFGQHTTAIGVLAYGSDGVDYALALGMGARVSVSGGVRVNGVPYLSADPDSTEINNILGHPDVSWTGQPAIARRAASQAVFVTDALDLTSGSAAVTLDLPAGTMLFIDAIDVVVTGSDTAAGSPEITVGPDDVTPASYLAATPVTKTVVGGRETHDPLVSDGVTSLRVATATAGTGTTYQAKIVFRGYVMEL